MQADTLELVRYMQLVQAGHSQRLEDLQTGRARDSTRISEIYARQDRIKQEQRHFRQRQDQMHDIIAALQAAQFGEGTSRGPAGADDDTAP
ncbi:hypothetical protein GCM10007867_32600 [Gluconobacter cerinus]|uniref:Uncharacterized protein n=1 Tax=Gluconobacter cerinus TaxID=38307 RepID=A0AAV5NK63_9PROT|nr:hypothetical protein GCM10007867_32600 [Gluconobacter cerinus]